MEYNISSLDLEAYGGNGMALIQDLVKMMKGEVSMKREAEKGTTLVITIPPNANLSNQELIETRPSFIQKLRNVVEQNISDDCFGITELCKAMCLSRSQLHNKIKAETGLSTSIYVRSIKLEKAKSILENTDMNISEVAYEVGFKDASYFSRLFTEKYGFAPSKTRTSDNDDGACKLIPLENIRKKTLPVKKNQIEAIKMRG